MRWFPFTAKEQQPSDQAYGNITIKMVPEDVPEFKRIYTARLDNRAKIEIEAYTMSFSIGRYYSGTLTQPNGNRIYFDPKQIADKIIDPLLVPLVKDCVADIFVIDREFLNRGPSEYVDERNHRWVRA